MTEIVNLGIKVQSQDLDKTSQKFDRLGQKSDSAFNRINKDVKNSMGVVASETKKAEGAFDRLKRSTLALGAAFSAAFVVQKIIRFSDTLKQLEGRLKIVTGTGKAFNQQFDFLFNLAQDARQPMEGLVQLFTRVGMSVKNNTDVMKNLNGVTEAFAKGLAITGESAASANGAIVQFSQGLASNFNAAGQEIQSLIEQAPRVALALADGLVEIGAVTRAGTGDLKRLAQDGILTNVTAAKALAAQVDDLQKEFDQLPLTVSQSLTQLDNAFLKLIGRSELINSGTNTLALAISGLANNLGLAANAAGAVAIAYGVGLASAFMKSSTEAITALRLTPLLAAEQYKQATAAVAVAEAELSMATAMARANLGVSASANQAIIAADANLMLARSQQTAAAGALTMSGAMAASSTMAARLGGVLKTAVGGALSFLASPAGIALVVASLYLFKDEISASAKAGNRFAGALDTIVQAVQNFLSWTGDKFLDAVDGMTVSLTSLAEMVGLADEGAAQFTAEMISARNAAKSASEGLDETTESTDKADKGLKDYGKTVKNTKDLVGDFTKQLQEMHQNIFDDRLKLEMTDTEQALLDIDRTVQKYTKDVGALNVEQKRLVETIKGQTVEYYKLKEQIERTKEADEARAQEAERQAELALEPLRTAIEDFHRLGRETFESLFNGDLLSSADNAAQAVKSIFVRLAAEMAALEFFGPDSFKMSGSGPIIGGANSGFGGGFSLSNLSSIGDMLSGSGLMRPIFGGGLGAGIDKLGLSLGFGSLAEIQGPLLPGMMGPAPLGVGVQNGLSQAFTPGAALGGMGGNMLADLIFGNRGMGASIGGSLGGIAGTAIGANMGTILGMAGGPAGALIGAFAGNALGGLFGNKKPSSKMQNGVVDLATGGVISRGGLRGDKFDEKNQDMVDTLASLASGISQALGIKSKFSVAAGNRNGLEFALTDDSHIFDYDNAQRKQFDTAGEFVTGLLEEFRKEFPDKFSETITTALNHIDFGDSEESLKKGLSDLAFAVMYDSLGETTEVLTASEQALKSVNEQFDAMAETAERLGLATEKVRIEQEKAIKALRDGFNKAVGSALIAETSPGTIALQEEMERYKTQLKEAAALGADTAQVEKLHQIRMQKIFKEQFLTESQAADTQQNQLQTLQEQQRVTDKLVNDYRSISLSLADGVKELRLSALSSLSPEDRYNEAKAQFEAIAQKALGGDADAARELRDVGFTFAEFSREYFATNDQNSEDLKRIEMVMSEVSDMFGSDADIQQGILDRVTEQVELLQGILEASKNQQSKASGTLDPFTGSAANAAGRSLSETLSSGLTVGQHEAIARAVLGGYAGPTGSGQLDQMLASQGLQGAFSQAIGQAVSTLPKHAGGGLFSANEPFIVGERGAEILQFNQGGRVIPMSGAGFSPASVEPIVSSVYAVQREISQMRSENSMMMLALRQEISGLRRSNDNLNSNLDRMVGSM